MPSYTVTLKPAVERQLKKLDSGVQQRLIAKMRSLAIDPRPPGCTKLKGAELYRVRVGDYRIIYEIQDNVLMVLVVKVGHRREVYE